MVSQEISILGISAAITVGIQLFGFAVAFAMQTETFYDIFGGINFITLGIYSVINGRDPTSNFFSPSNIRKSTCTFIFVISRSWLLLFLAWRAYERKGDSRFDEVKNKFWIFLLYWTMQGIWVFCISLPVIFVNSSDKFNDGDGDGKGGMSVFELIMIFGFGFGVLTEIVADITKAKWVKNGRIGLFCSIGLWKYSRHPNYFGEIFQWWCAFLFAYGSSNGVNDIQWWTSIVSPLITMHILLNTAGTGVYNANGKNLKRYYDSVPEEYTAYRKKTSILIPLPFGLYEYIPMFLKRTIFLDFMKYEYIAADSGDDDNGVREEQELLS